MRAVINPSFATSLFESFTEEHRYARTGSLAAVLGGGRVDRGGPREVGGRLLGADEGWLEGGVKQWKDRVESAQQATNRDTLLAGSAAISKGYAGKYGQ